MLAGTTGLTNAWRFRGAWSYTHAALSQDSPGLLEGGADAFKDDRLSGAPRQQGSLLASSWRPRGRCPVAPARSEAEAAANAHLVVGDVSPDVVEIPTGLTPRAQVLQSRRLITASLGWNAQNRAPPEAATYGREGTHGGLAFSSPLW